MTHVYFFVNLELICRMNRHKKTCILQEEFTLQEDIPMNESVQEVIEEMQAELDELAVENEALSALQNVPEDERDENTDTAENDAAIAVSARLDKIRLLSEGTMEEVDEDYDLVPDEDDEEDEDED